MDYDVLFKIILIGDSGVGKSNLITRYTRDIFLRDSKTTIGIEFATKTIEHRSEDNQATTPVVVRAQLWDTAGQCRFRSLATSFYRGAHGALICFDTTSRQSFDNLEDWLRELLNTGEEECINVLVGTKSDLGHIRAVGTEEAVKFAQKHGMHYLETSALNNSNVNEAFEDLIKTLFRQKKHLVPHNRPQILPPSPQNPGPLTEDPPRTVQTGSVCC